MRLKRKITGRSQVTNECIESREIGIVRENAGEFVEQRILAGVSKEAARHCYFKTLAHYEDHSTRFVDHAQRAACLRAGIGPVASVFQPKRTRSAAWSKGAGWWRCRRG